MMMMMGKIAGAMMIPNCHCLHRPDCWLLIPETPRVFYVPATSQGVIITNVINIREMFLETLKHVFIITCPVF